MSEHSTNSSNKDSLTPQHTPNNDGVGGAGFDGEFASQSGDIKSMLNNSSGDAPPDPKTILQMQSVFGNRATLQLLRKNNPNSTIQRKKKTDAYPFSGLRMVQRAGGDNTVSEEEDLDLGDDFDDDDFDDESGYDADDEYDDDDDDDDFDDESGYDADDEYDDDDDDDDFDDESGYDADDEYDDDDDDTDDDSDFDDDDDLDDDDNPLGNVADFGIGLALDDDTDSDSDSDTESDTESDTGSGGGSSVGHHVGGAAKNIGKGVLNATVGLGMFSVIDFWKGVLEVDEEKQQTLYGDNWKAWTFLENTVNLTQAIADITTSIGFITAIAGAITSILFPPAGPFLILMSTIAGTFATIAHIITGVGRIILGIKLATRLSELENDPEGQALVKGTMIRQFIGAVANTVGAVTGGLGGAFSPVSSAASTSASLAGQSGASAAAKAGASALGTGVTNQAIGGSSGDTANAITTQATEHYVERSADDGLMQRVGDEDAIGDIDEQIKKIQLLKTNLKGGLPDVDASLTADQETKQMRQEQLAGVNEGLPQLGELDKATSQAKEQAEQAESASESLEQVKDAEPPEEKKKSFFGKIKSAVKKALKKFLAVFAGLKRKVMGLIAKVKAKLTKFMMKLLGVDKPAKEIEGVMQDKQKALPSAMAKQDENKQQTVGIKDEVTTGIGDLDKAEQAALDYKQQLLEQPDE